MKQQLFRFTFFLLICLSIPLTAAAQTADIPDPNLRDAIENALGKASGATITADDMATLTGLEARNANISDLTGLEGATNLTALVLGIEVQAGRAVNSNSVSDISALAELTNLTVLNLRFNSVSDISALAGLTNLTELWLQSNTIPDISALAGLTNLTELWLQSNTISDISALAGLTNLTELYLGGNSVSDISVLAGLTNLTELDLGGNSVLDISVLAGLTNLTKLYLGGRSVSDISVLAGLTNLTELYLLVNLISDLSPLVENMGLGAGDQVYVWVNPLSYLSIHTHIPALQGRGVIVEFDNQAHPALLKISGDTQKGVSSSPLSDPFVVEAQDENGSVLAGISVTFAVITGDGTLSVTSTTTDVNGRAQSILTLGPKLGANTVEVSADGIEVPATFYAISDTVTADVNGDGVVNLLDLIFVGYILENEVPDLTADVNRDGVVSIQDLVLVAGIFGYTAAAPSASSQVPETLTAIEVQQWLTDAKTLEVTDPIMERGIAVLQQLLVSLTPTETQLLANYPNPFNPETWIPYRLAEDAFVTLTIYDQAGQVVRTIDVGYQVAAAYERRSKAIYWDGRNQVGETVASGVYFYHLSAGDYSATRKMLILK